MCGIGEQLHQLEQLALEKRNRSVVSAATPERVIFLTAFQGLLA